MAVLYVFVAMKIGSRRILHVNVTALPTAGGARAIEGAVAHRDRVWFPGRVSFLQSHFFKAACQFNTTLMGEGGAEGVSAGRESIRNFLPSAETS
jgi:hypothetical protein